MRADLVGHHLWAEGQHLGRFGLVERAAAQESGQEMGLLAKFDTERRMRLSRDPTPMSGT
ncbi:MAG: hypothetical protein P8R42_18015 [Candidatus Binatia bacterium]|nr:hypothetical protein [Candidatus Binatia bacterium]